MKIKYGDSHHYCVKVYSEFSSLWNANDDAWVASRKEAWRNHVKIVGVSPKTKFVGEYYVYGKEPPDFVEDENTGEIQVINFDFYRRLSLTPFKTSEQVQSFFDKTLGSSITATPHGSALSVGGVLDAFPEHDFMVQLITEALFCDKYFAPEASEAVKKKLITPRYFISSYAGVSSFYKKKNTHDLDWRNFAFDYFMKCVRYCELSGDLDASECTTDLTRMYYVLINQDDAKLNSYRLNLKQKLIGVAESENGPKVFKEALRLAPDFEDF